MAATGTSSVTMMMPHDVLYNSLSSHLHRCWAGHEKGHSWSTMTNSSMTFQEVMSGCGTTPGKRESGTAITVLIKWNILRLWKW